jgi:hypothetical protein
MKTLALFLILCFGSLAFADDFKTISGKEYKNVKVSRVEPDGIVIKFSGGIVKIPFTELSPEIQKKYAYDSQAVGAYSAEQNEQQAALVRQRKADEQQRLEERQKYWNEHPAPQQAQPQTQPQTSASSMHGSALDQRPAGSSSTHGSMLDERSAGPQVLIYGKVLNVVDEGLLISVRETNSIGSERIPDRATALLVGNFPGFYDRDKVQATGYLVGSYDYATVMGSRRHTRALKNVSVTKLTEFPSNVRG